MRTPATTAPPPDPGEVDAPHELARAHRGLARGHAAASHAGHGQ